ncbi:MAG: hypothetical protein AB7I48_17595 [Planctomycetaceae bacterium]
MPRILAIRAEQTNASPWRAVIWANALLVTAAAVYTPWRIHWKRQ